MPLVVAILGVSGGWCVAYLLIPPGTDICGGMDVSPHSGCGLRGDSSGG